MSGGVRGGAGDDPTYSILRVGIVLRGGVRAVSNKPGLWTRSPAKITHQSPVFSYWAGFLFFLWTSAFKSKGGFEHEVGRFRICLRGGQPE